jgi:hypothetical protein
MTTDTKIAIIVLLILYPFYLALAIRILSAIFDYYDRKW